jgi:hypothetical protein
VKRLAYAGPEATVHKSFPNSSKGSRAVSAGGRACCPSTRVARSSFTCISIAFELSFRPVEDARFEIFREML